MTPWNGFVNLIVSSQVVGFVYLLSDLVNLQVYFILGLEEHLLTLVRRVETYLPNDVAYRQLRLHPAHAVKVQLAAITVK